MHVLFEDDGAFRAGTILADNDTSLQIETVSGKRMRVTAYVKTDSLGASGGGEFAFVDIAAEYFGCEPRPGQAAALAFCLHASPMYFYKKGKGRYKAAPPEALKAALAGSERKRREAEDVAALAAELKSGRLPPAIRDALPMLLFRPDKQAIASRAVAAACEAAHTSALSLLAACGAIPSTHDYHFDRFLFEAFPRGTAFADYGSVPDAPVLPLAPVAAFSIDDATTTEIDDAFSVRALSSGNVEVGIHIAAPAVAIPRGSALDAIARSRLSTVYMPGRKITMLPDEVIARFTLAAGAPRPALSLYIETAPDGAPIRQTTRLERVPVAANLHLDAVGGQFAAPASPSDPRWTDELRALWRLAQKLESARGKPDQPRVDYTFIVDWDAAPGGRVAIVPRPRGSPLDKLVAELMIHVNSSWGKLLDQAGAPGLYRTQQSGKVKMSTKPEPHQGLGVAHYLWASSPLRRYSDLVNQRQLIAAVAGEPFPYGEGDAELFAVLADFEATYAQYAEFQSRMEHYWCLRWLEQERLGETTASVVRDNLVRLDALPLVVRVADLPAGAGPRLRLALGRIDLLAGTIEVRYAGVAPC